MEEPDARRPNWSPSGKSGWWVWEEESEKDPRTGKYRPCWKWYDDDWNKPDHKIIKKSKQKNSWWRKLLRI